MPTIKDRIQVLLQPQEYADLVLMSKEERRSHGSMGAILIEEAINARKRAGTYVPEREESEEALEIAKLRRMAKQMGKGVNDLVDTDQMSTEDLLGLMTKLIKGK